MSNQHEISIKINLAGITGRMQRVLRDAMNMVAIGFNAKENITAENLTIPDITIHHQFNSSSNKSIGEEKVSWEIWVLRNGFRDIAEELNVLLEEIQTVLAYWKIVTIQKSRVVRGEDWNEIIAHRSQQFHRRTLPQKLEFLDRKYHLPKIQSLLIKHLQLM